MRCTMGSGAKPPETGIFENFCIKSNFTVCLQLTFNCKIQGKMGEQDVLLGPPIILLGGEGGGNCSACPPPGSHVNGQHSVHGKIHYGILEFLRATALLCYSGHYAIARPSVCLSVCLSHGWISQKRLKLGS